MAHISHNKVYDIYVLCSYVLLRLMNSYSSSLYSITELFASFSLMIESMLEMILRVVFQTSVSAFTRVHNFSENIFLDLISSSCG